MNYKVKKCRFFSPFQLKPCLDCNASYQLSFIDTSTDKPYNKTTSNYMNAAAYFRFISEECKIDIESYVTASDPIRESKALYYSLLVTLMCLGHLYATIQIIKSISQNEYDGGRYSLITLCIFTIWDVFLCLLHLYNALTTEVNKYFLINGLFQRISSITSSPQLFGSLSYLLFSKQE